MLALYGEKQKTMITIILSARKAQLKTLLLDTSIMPGVT